MWIILVSLVIGIIIGILKFLPKRFMKYNSKFQQIGVMILLFSMGASIGANRELISKLRDMGLVSLTFALATTVFSIAAVYFVSIKFLGEDKK